MSAIFGELLHFSQKNGPDVRLRVYGDEHYAYYETNDGYTAIYDEVQGQFCYADLKGNQFVSTGVPVDRLPPANIVRHLQESITVKLAKIEERKLLHHPPGAELFERIVRAFGPNQGLLEGRQLSSGSVRGLTILVNFQDVRSTATAMNVDEMLNGENFTLNGNICSVREYFRQVSSNKLDYTNTVVGPFTLSHSRDYYINNLLVAEALQLAVNSGLDLTQFDSRNEGIIDALNILYAGQSLYQGELWPHNFSIDLQFGSMRTNLYLLTGLGRNASELTIGTFCHENGHLLCRFPDMYDYGTQNREGDAQPSAGIGFYCLMGAGNHLDNGRSPAPVCAYLRDLAGWCDNVVDLNRDDTYEAIHGDYNTVMKYRTSRSNEYFLVENRTRIGLDRSGPSSGLAIYHCDIFGSNEFQQGTADHHYQCALLQADGLRELENNLNQGDGADLFGQVAGIALTSSTRPHTREWNGRESGLIISDISKQTNTIQFRVGRQNLALNVQKESVVRPMASAEAMNSVPPEIHIDLSGVVRKIKVIIDVNHNKAEPMILELFSPTRRRAVLNLTDTLYNDNVVVTFDSENPGELSKLVGQPIQGNWMLNIVDQTDHDIGKITKWSLDIDSASV